MTDFAIIPYLQKFHICYAPAVASIIEQGGEVETFCFMRSALFDKLFNLDATTEETSWFLSLTIAAEDVPGSVQQCCDRQKRLLAYRVIHDGIYGKYQNERHPRVALPACAIMQVRRVWPQDVTGDDLLRLKNVKNVFWENTL